MIQKLLKKLFDSALMETHRMNLINEELKKNAEKSNSFTSDEAIKLPKRIRIKTYHLQVIFKNGKESHYNNTETNEDFLDMVNWFANLKREGYIFKYNKGIQAFQRKDILTINTYYKEEWCLE